MENFWIAVANISAVVVWVRFIPFVFNRNNKDRYDLNVFPAVSIIIPVRNESRVIDKLLKSLLALDYPDLEIIVVDDGSTDNTAAIASRFPVKLMQAGARPQGWTGKCWACSAGAQEARGKLLLFTDADTVHKPDSLRRAVSWMTHANADMISLPAWHRNELWWEKFLGPFFCTMYCGASPFDKTSVKHPYALGHYLLIDEKFYQYIGGHASVRDALADDASLARRVINHGGRFRMVGELRLCEIQMYHSFHAFWFGWLRILRLGMRELKISVVLNTLFAFMALDLAALPHRHLLELLPVLSLLGCFTVVQRKIGNFSIWGTMLLPLGMILFLLMAVWASVTEALDLPVKWKGRSYAINGKSKCGESVSTDINTSVMG